MGYENDQRCYEYSRELRTLPNARAEEATRRKRQRINRHASQTQGSIYRAKPFFGEHLFHARTILLLFCVGSMLSLLLQNFVTMTNAFIMVERSALKHKPFGSVGGDTFPYAVTPMKQLFATVEDVNSNTPTSNATSRLLLPNLNRNRHDDTGRRTIEADLVDALKDRQRCRTILDVYCLLRDSLILFDHTGDSNEHWNKLSLDDYLRKKISPNVAAIALRRIVDMRINKSNTSPAGAESDVKISNKLTTALLQSASLGATPPHAKKRRVPVPAGESLNLYGMTDLLYSIARLTKKKTGYSNHSRNTKVNSLEQYLESTRPLVEALCSALLSSMKRRGVHKSLISLGQHRLVEMLYALAVLRQRQQVDLLSEIGNTLTLGNVLGKLYPSQLSLVLWSYATLDRPHVRVLEIFMRRLRKKVVHEQFWRRDQGSMEIARALWASAKLVERLELLSSTEKLPGSNPGSDEDEDDAKTIEIDALREKAQTMCHTLLRTLMSKRPSANVTDTDADNDIGNLNIHNVTSEQPLFHSLSARELADVFWACVTLDFVGDEPILLKLSDQLTNHTDIISRASVKDIARLFWAYQCLRWKDHTDTLEKLSESFLIQIRKQSCERRDLMTVLRSAVSLGPGRESSKGILRGVYEGATAIILGQTNENNENDKHSYLSSCNEFEVSNIALSFAKAQWYDEDMLSLLIERMLSPDIVETCTPISASRFLFSVTVLSAQNDDEESIRPVFRALSPLLLSTQITPVDASAAMWAMAKTSYMFDLGVFDHLAEALACDFMLENTSTRQATQALWACGKMASWENRRDGNMPYISSAKKYSLFLAHRYENMSRMDFARSIWALGRLDINDRDIVGPILEGAVSIADTFNSQELANIIWGLSRIDAGSNSGSLRELLREKIPVLTHHVTSPTIMEKCSSQEAANVLLSMGRMKIADANVFRKMSQVMMRQLADATPQCISNALWAHQVCRLEYPQELFDCWANQKLGLVGLNAISWSSDDALESTDDFVL